MIRCPKCKSNLAVPDHKNAEMVLHCPRCRTDVELHERSERGTGPGDAPGSLSEESSTTRQSDKKSRVVRRRYYSRSRLPKKVASAKVRRRRRKPKTKFTRADFVKIIVGGLMAFPVAQLIIWWGFAKDPLQLGPRVAAAVPFIVPRPFRGEAPAPIAEPRNYVTNPESSLLQGKPFDFGRQSTKSNSSPIQRGMPRKGAVPIQNKINPIPAGGSDDGNH